MVDKVPAPIRLIYYKLISHLASSTVPNSTKHWRDSRRKNMTLCGLANWEQTCTFVIIVIRRCGGLVFSVPVS